MRNKQTDASPESLQGEEARLRWMSKVFMDAADPILIEDLNGNVIDMNHEAERTYDWGRDELLGQSIRAIVPKERHTQAIELLARCKRGDDVRNVEGLRQHKNGEIIPVLVTLSLLRDELGQPIGIASLAKDISEQKAAQEELRTLSRVFMESADPILIEDLDGIVTDMNHEAGRAYGWARERPIDIASLAKDITEQKAVEAKLRTMSKVFMEAADPILIEDLDGVVSDMNQEAERAYGWKRD